MLFTFIAATHMPGLLQPAIVYPISERYCEKAFPVRGEEP